VKAVNKVGLQVMSAVLLPLVCGSCATQSGILYGSKIELEAGSDRGNGSKAKVDELGTRVQIVKRVSEPAGLFGASIR
jgi:hypothetical protein